MYDELDDLKVPPSQALLDLASINDFGLYAIPLEIIGYIRDYWK